MICLQRILQIVLKETHAQGNMVTLDCHSGVTNVEFVGTSGQQENKTGQHRRFSKR
jgi:hypothetical protein